MAISKFLKTVIIINCLTYYILELYIERMDDKEILDIKDIVEEFNRLDSRIKILSDRFNALAMDYREHIDSSFKNDKIFNVRDMINYRLFASIFHLKLLLKQINVLQNNPEKYISNPFEHDFSFSIFIRELNSLLDSFIYHITSVFDYIGTLFLIISDKNKDGYMTWNKLFSSVTGKRNYYFNKSYVEIVKSVHNGFVSKLYKYRSESIHKKPDYIGNINSIKFGVEGGLSTAVVAGKQLIRGFKELKTLDKKFNMTLSYISIWIINQTIDKITDLLFALKHEIELNPKNFHPLSFRIYSSTDMKITASKVFWNEDLYKNKDIKS